MKKKKGETKHHLCYHPELILKLPSKGAHLIITSFQSMKATPQNIEYLDNMLKTIQFIKWQKEMILKNELE